MTMIELVARALFEKQKPEYAGEASTWERVDEEDREGFRGLARAAFEAMRLSEDEMYDPSNRLVDALQTEVDIWPEERPRPSPNSVQFLSREESAAIWNAGIDAAIEEAPCPRKSAQRS